MQGGGPKNILMAIVHSSDTPNRKILISVIYQVLQKTVGTLRCLNTSPQIILGAGLGFTAKYHWMALWQNCLIIYGEKGCRQNFSDISNCYGKKS